MASIQPPIIPHKAAASIGLSEMGTKQILKETSLELWLNLVQCIGVLDLNCK